MIYLEIPYVSENNRISRISAENEIQALTISDEAKSSVYEAIYHRHPGGVTFEDKELKQVLLLENVLRRLGIPYRKVDQ